MSGKIYKLYPPNYSDWTYVQPFPNSRKMVNGTIVRNTEKSYRVIVILSHFDRKPMVKSFFMENRPRTVLNFGVEFDCTQLKDAFAWVMSTKIVEEGEGVKP